jgi:hypothetical protein
MLAAPQINGVIILENLNNYPMTAGVRRLVASCTQYTLRCIWHLRVLMNRTVAARRGRCVRR